MKRHYRKRINGSLGEGFVLYGKPKAPSIYVGKSTLSFSKEFCDELNIGTGDRVDFLYDSNSNELAVKFGKSGRLAITRTNKDLSAEPLVNYTTPMKWFGIKPLLGRISNYKKVGNDTIVIGL